MKYAADRPYSDPERAARKLLEIANCVEDDRIYIELWPFLYREKGTPAEYKAGLDLAIERGWLDLHESRHDRGGATARSSVLAEQGDVSIHAPREGGAPCRALFNPRPAKGAT